jgi:hypothetical protein
MYRCYDEVTKNMNDVIDLQAISDKAYEHVLRHFGLPPGAKLHEDPDRVECWQSYFVLFLARAKAGEAAESEQPLLREAAE